MCSMSLTFEVRLRSKFVTNALLHLFRREPVVRQRTLTTGMSMYGKISTGMVDDRGSAQDGDQNSHDDEGIRAAEGEPDDPHEEYSALQPQYSEH